MPCFHPIAGWLSRSLTKNGRRGITFAFSEGFKDRQIEVPCGKCIGCKIEKSRRWAIRLEHESQMHERKCFLTLTYAPDMLPPGGSLRPRDMVLFLKRLRKYADENEGVSGIRFYQVGEYGSKLGRPHHHMLLFGYEFGDKRLLKRSSENKLYMSKTLEELWGYGQCGIGEVTFASAAYCARYAVKKITGPSAAEHYKGRVPEYATMSRRPGIGATWIEKFAGDVYPHDACVLRGGAKVRPPDYYDRVLEKVNPVLFDELKEKRKLSAMFDDNNSGKRLIVREQVKTAQVDTFLKRGFENGGG